MDTMTNDDTTPRFVEGCPLCDTATANLRAATGDPSVCSPCVEHGLGDLPPARYGQVVYTRPTPTELARSGDELRDIRDELSALRSRLQNLQRRWGHTFAPEFRDSEAFMTAALVFLYEPSKSFHKWADTKTIRLEHPEHFVIKEGFSSPEREEDFAKADLLEKW